MLNLLINLYRNRKLEQNLYIYKKKKNLNAFNRVNIISIHKQIALFKKFKKLHCLARYLAGGIQISVKTWGEGGIIKMSES